MLVCHTDQLCCNDGKQSIHLREPNSADQWSKEPMKPNAIQLMTLIPLLDIILVEWASCSDHSVSRGQRPDGELLGRGFQKFMKKIKVRDMCISTNFLKMPDLTLQGYFKNLVGSGTKR